MANEEQLAILRQGVEVWNKWREENDYSLTIDLSGTDLSKADLAGIVLVGAYLSGINLREANLVEADLSITDLADADLSRANLAGANLVEASLGRADLTGADLRKARLGSTILGRLDLSQVAGLGKVIHGHPSSLGIDVIQKSKGKIPKAFLRGCGLSDWEIEAAKLYNPDLANEERNKILYTIYDLQASQAIQVSPLFISYSQKDNSFVDKVENQLNNKGIRFWRDIHDLKSGRMEKQIDRAIRQNPTVLLVLSEHSLSSDWVEHEVRSARQLEKDMERDVLCPVALDDSWKDSKWPKRIMEQIMEYNILDFSGWEDDVKFEGMFRKLIDGLELFYKG